MWRIVLAVALCWSASGVARAERTPSSSITLETFESALAGYGGWLETARHGVAWRPTAPAPGWRPYLEGSWQWTQEGWFWTSDEPWAWATYHYGRWVLDAQYSWLWVPGFEWAPAWVDWRVGEGLIGWAPLSPRAETMRASMDHWTFVRASAFLSPRVGTAAESPIRLGRNWASTRPAPGPRSRLTALAPLTPSFGGPSREFVEQQVGFSLGPTRLYDVASPADLDPGRSDQVYRPGHLPALTPTR